MKYVVSKHQTPFYTNISVEESIKLLTSTLYVDTETSGLSPIINELLTVQIKCENNSILIDCTTIDIFLYKEKLETLPIVFHNAKFDLQFLYKNNIWPFENVHCTLIREKIITSSNYDKRAYYSLANLVKIYKNKTLDKSSRKLISKKTIYSKEVLEYAFMDVEYLDTIFEKQQLIMIKEDLETTYSLEKLFIPVIAYVEYCGFKINVEKWQDKMRINESEYEEALFKLNAKAVEYKMCPLSLFEGCYLNWNSPAQVINAFKTIGISIEVDDKKKGGKKFTVEAKELVKYKSHEVVSAYLDYKKKAKILSSYGYNYLNNALSFEDNRIRTSFSQIVKTGRMSGSDENDDFKETDKINLQNVPKVTKENEYRAERLCFEPDEGNVFVVSDYSQQEQIIMANQSADPALISFFTKPGKNDMHCFVARYIYPELSDTTDEEIKESHGEKRNIAKQGGFCLNYNGSFRTLALNLGIPVSEGEFIYNKYFELFSGLKREFEKRKAFCQNYGYIVTNNVTKRKIYFDVKKIQEDLKDINWDDYKLGKANYPKFVPYFNKVLKALRKKSAIDNAAVNYPTQSTGSDMIKLGAIKFFKWIRDNNLLNIVKIPNIVHDELVTECPEEMAEEVAYNQKRCKIESGNKFCKIVPIGVDVKISEKWLH